MSWNVKRMGEIRNIHNFLVGKSKWKKLEKNNKGKILLKWILNMV